MDIMKYVYCLTNKTKLAIAMHATWRLPDTTSVVWGLMTRTVRYPRYNFNSLDFIDTPCSQSYLYVIYVAFWQLVQ